MNHTPAAVRRARPPSAAGLEFLVLAPQARAVVVFVHGLGGHPWTTWGAAGQPGAFITRLQADLPQVAVATYAYANELKTIMANDSLTLDTMARDWSRQIRNALLARFDTVVIVAHCLGGLLTTLGVCALRETPDAPEPEAPQPVPKQLILFLLDVPHDLPEAGPSSWLAGLLAALRFTPAALRAHAARWRTDVFAAPGAPLAIQPYAVVSEQASWVTPLRPQADLPPARVCHADLSHEDLTHAPADGAFVPYDFVLARLRERL